MTVTVLSGRVRLKPEHELVADMLLTVRFEGDQPTPLALRLVQAEGETVQAVAAETMESVELSPDGGAVARYAIPIDVRTEPVSDIRVCSLLPDGALEEAAYADDGYFARALYFFSKRSFEKGFFVRRKRSKDQDTLLFAAEQLSTHYRLSIAHRAVAAVVYAYRVIDLEDQWRSAGAVARLDAAFEAAKELKTTYHPRTDRDHLLQSLQMARWQMMVFVQDAPGLLQTLVAAMNRTHGLSYPIAINTYNACRMYMVGGYLLHRYGRRTEALNAFRAGIAFFATGLANEAAEPNTEWAFPQSDFEETQGVVDRMGRFVAAIARGDTVLGEQDEVVVSATRLLQSDSRAAIVGRFDALVRQIAEAASDQAIPLPEILVRPPPAS